MALLAVLLAWRYQRWFAWVQIPFAAGLVLGTVYLRHHWVVDILAGFVITLLAFWAGPRIEDWWVERSAAGGASGVEEASGAGVPGDPARAGRNEPPASRVAAKVMES